MRIFIKSILARLRAWWASQIMDEPEEEPIYHILPHPETNSPVTKGPEDSNGQRL